MTKKGTEREITNRRESVTIVKKEREGTEKIWKEVKANGREPLAAPQFPLKGVSREWS